jgi:glycerophosphoryl diester phosphodiesterase
MAHRGGAAESPENSPTAFQHSVDLGFRWIETDVRATIDGHAVVFHDATLNRTTDTTGALSSLPLAQVRATRLADGHPPLTLAEALNQWPSVHFNVDVKSDDAVAPFLRAVAEADAWDRVCAASFSASRLTTLRRLAGPRLATSMGPSEVTRLALGAPWRTTACAAQVPHRARGVPLVTSRFVHRAHVRGVQIHVWTINDPVEMAALLDLGVDGLITDRPTVLRGLLHDRGCWP